MTKPPRRETPRLRRQVLKLQDRRLLEGAMATAAIVAMADRKLMIEESIAVKGVLEKAKLLKLYDPEIALGLYTTFVDQMRRDHATGKEAAMKAVALCADDIEAAELVVHVGITIAKADQVLAAVELEAIEEICGRIGIRGLDAQALAGSAPDRPN